jgi:hypothetical protein
VRRDEARFPFKRGTWYFDADAYNAWLAAEATDHDRLLVDRFRTLTQAVIRDADAEGRGYLEWVRVIDHEDFADDEYIHVDKWYAMGMARQLTAGPGDNHIMLVIPALRLAGWSEDDIDSLIVGDRLGALVRRAPSEALTNEVAPHLDDRRYGGWLDAARASELGGRLENATDLFERPTAQVLDLYPKDLTKVRDFLRRAFQEELTLLEASARTDLATRIVTRF